MMVLPAVVFGLGSSVLLGRAAVSWLLPGPSRNVQLPTSEIWGLSIVLGVGLTGWLSFLWSWMNGTLGFRFSVGLVSLSSFLGIWAVWQASSGPVPLPVLTGRRLVRTCQWLIGLLVALAFLQTVLTPQRFWDERAIFAIKSRVLFEDSSVNSPALLNPDFVQYHPKYPLMLPLAEQHLYSLLGDVDDRWSKLWFPLMYAGLVLTMTGVLSRHFGAAWSWTCGLLLATVPVLMPDEYGFLCAQADAPMACFHGVAVLCLWDALKTTASREKCRRMLLAGFVASCAAFVKDEGIAFLIVDGLSWGMAMIVAAATFRFLRRRPDGDSSNSLAALLRLNLLSLLIFIAVAGAMLVPWLAHRRQLPDTTEMNYAGRFSIAMLSGRLSTLQWSFPHLARQMFGEWKNQGMQWWVGLAAIVTRPRKALEPSNLFLILNLAGALAALLVAGMLAPAELEEHLGGSTFRFLMQLVPVVILLTASLWSDKEFQMFGQGPGERLGVSPSGSSVGLDSEG